MHQNKKEHFDTAIHNAQKPEVKAMLQQEATRKFERRREGNLLSWEV
jgi:hypothetical protein